jgi:antitoxin component YwqK of YwqJK toxin-antitoxin module
MLAILPYDILNKILQFQEPKEIIALHKSCKELIQETIKHTNFIINCKVVLSDEEIEWFQTKNINVKLLEEYKIDKNKINNDFSKYWYKNGKLHRDNDLPAIIYKLFQDEEEQYWFKNGKLHRDNDLPAIISSIGYQGWYKNGEIHRDNDLPAVIHQDGHQYWYKNGKLHREHNLPAEISSNGNQCWYKNGKLHREHNLPAIISLNGYQEWYKNGVKYNPV